MREETSLQSQKPNQMVMSGEGDVSLQLARSALANTWPGAGEGKTMVKNS